MDVKDIVAAVNQFLDISLFSLAGTPVTVGSVLVFAVIVLVTFLISHSIRRALGRLARSRGMTEEGTVGVASRLIHYTVLLTGIGIALHTVGVNLSAFFAAGALFAVALGFAMQNITANFVSGVILLMERSIKPGDVLEIEGRMVKVREMGIRATIARTLDDEDLLIPNSTLVQSSVKNFTFRDRLYRLRAQVGVAYSSDLKAVRQSLESAARALEWRAKDHEPTVLLTEFGSSSVNYEISVWINDPWRMRRKLSDLNEQIWWALKDAGIVIAFPQVDVHFDPPVAESIDRFGRAV